MTININTKFVSYELLKQITVIQVRHLCVFIISYHLLDGVKEKDKKNISNILREVSECKSNSFDLKRTMWNDVSEDWPFYTEQDRAALRRRKPQNLTPPGSDTGSTSSGHSPLTQ